MGECPGAAVAGFPDGSGINGAHAVLLIQHSAYPARLH